MYTHFFRWIFYFIFSLYRFTHANKRTYAQGGEKCTFVIQINLSRQRACVFNKSCLPILRVADWNRKNKKRKGGMFKALSSPLTRLARGLFTGPGNQSGSVLNSSHPPSCSFVMITSPQALLIRFKTMSAGFVWRNYYCHYHTPANCNQIRRLLSYCQHRIIILY